MKIRKLDREAAELLGQTDKVRANDRQKSGQREAAELLLRRSDRVSLNLGKYMSDELNPEKIEQDRASRIEELKKRVQDGSYKVASSDVARALATEVAMEVASASMFDSDEL